MLISSGMLKNSIEKYDNYKKLKETYKSSRNVDSTEEVNGEEVSDNMKISMFNLVFMLVVSFMFFLLELMLLIVAVMMAINCTAPGKERFVHVVLAVFYTAPYLLLMAILNPEAKAYLKSSLSMNSSDSKSCMWK
jgi:hypothetical protein